MEHGQPSSQPYSQNRFQRSKSFKNLGSGLDMHLTKVSEPNTITNLDTRMKLQKVVQVCSEYGTKCQTFYKESLLQ